MENNLVFQIIYNCFLLLLPFNLLLAFYYLQHCKFQTWKKCWGVLRANIYGICIPEVFSALWPTFFNLRSFFFIIWMPTGKIWAYDMVNYLISTKVSHVPMISLFFKVLLVNHFNLNNTEGNLTLCLNLSVPEDVPRVSSSTLATFRFYARP